MIYNLENLRYCGCLQYVPLKRSVATHTNPKLGSSEFQYCSHTDTFLVRKNSFKVFKDMENWTLKLKIFVYQTPKHSKGHVMLNGNLNEEMIEIESCDVDP